MKLLLIALLATPFHAIAERGPKEVDLDPTLAKELGFSIVVKEVDGVVLIEIDGPIKDRNGCLAARSGSFLLDEKGNELIVHQTDILGFASMPKATGYYSNKEHTMGVYFDYLCRERLAFESTRYTLQSIRQWLITKSSKATPKSGAL